MPLPLPTDELVRIANAGGGLTLNAKQYLPTDLERIAHAASQQTARLTIQNAARLTADDLTRIAEAGRGAVSYEF